MALISRFASARFHQFPARRLLPTQAKQHRFSTSASALWPLDLNLRHLPPISCVIGYGSGVFRQAGYDSSKRPMVDLIFVVKDGSSADWHQENLTLNKDHYSSLRFLGSQGLASVQNWGPGLYYNPHVKLETQDGGSIEAKYGVMETSALLKDLQDWSSLYVAGRLHKPCTLEFPKQDSTSDLLLPAVDSNRRAALCAAVLCAGHTGSEQLSKHSLLELLSSLVRLSFDGDVRSGIAENPNKVSNIVKSQARDLWDIYSPIAVDLGFDVSNVSLDDLVGEDSYVGVDISLEGRKRLWAELPQIVQKSAAQKSSSSNVPFDDGGDALRSVLRDVVRRSSMQQTAKGVLTAGVGRGFRYALQKVGKRLGK
eukprot:TRINITY_DN26037_c0_g1_i1.p1 TRINITY_DN26037_c0_g1~~TRINITY_DN26037_c0_g1_i1.p1  ORF type:complete len:377 (+),score=68.04 TRINITY_DN26037_c0_g1_i1:30-1133(+)